MTGRRTGELLISGREGDVLQRLLDADQVLLPMPVKVELLSGTSKRHRDALRLALSALPPAYPPTTPGG